MSSLTVLLADDHGIVRTGLRAVLEEEGHVVVAEAANGRDAVRLCAEHHPDAAVIDIAMPQLNGIDAAAQIRKASPNTLVIMLSMYSDESYILRALNSGAKGYLLKDSAAEDLLPALRAATAGKSYFSPAIAKTLLEDYVRFLRQRKLDDTYDLLTEREREVLQLLAEGNSNKDVANLLNLSLSTVETHRTNLMQKLNLHSTADIVLYAVRKKIICAPENP